MYTRSILIPITFLLLTACGSKPNSDAASGDALSGNINIDGSSTVYPITEAVAEEFQKVQPGVKVSVALSGRPGERSLGEYARQRNQGELLQLRPQLE